MHQHLRYRPQIDGLRAIAVGGVVIFHFGASWIPGGYIGVDVFFVISGFLISKSIYREISDGSFSIASFYERRARRILPAFIVITLATSLAASVLLFPNQLKSYSESLVWSVLFSANIYFYLTSNYFAAGAEELPLLHYWSLGVEEQFYIFFPLLVALFRRRVGWMVPGLLLASLVACEVVRQSSPSAAFYLLPFRAFEILIGATLALPAMRFPKSRLVGGLAVLAGAALIVAGMVVLTGASPFPGLLALVPCLGAALVIWGSEQGEAPAWTLLGSAPMRFYGRISYSLYLIHWPVVVFTRMVAPDLDPLVFLIGGCAACTGLAWLSFRFIETPVRQGGRNRLPRWAVFGGALAASLVILCGAGVTIRAEGFPGRLTEEVQRMLTYRNYPYQPVFREGVCFLRPEQTAADLDRSVCLPEGRPDVVLWGSSHIAHFYFGMAPVLAAQGYTLGQITGSGCVPLVGVDVATRPNCRGLNDFAIDWLLKNRPRLVITGGDAMGPPETLSVLNASIAKLRAAGIQVIVLGPVAYFNKPVPNLLAERLQRGDRGTRSRSEIVNFFPDNEQVLKRFYRERFDVQYVSFIGSFCAGGKCSLAVDGVPANFDTVHFTEAGSTYYGRLLADIAIADLRAPDKAAAGK